VDAKTLAPLDAAPDDLKAAFTNISFVKGDGSKGFHNFQYARAILDKVDADLKKLEQPQVTPTTVAPTQQPTPVPPTQTPAPTITPTVTAGPQAAPGASWIIWIALAAVVVIIIATLFMRRPQAS
jgi:hypothetical protein